MATSTVVINEGLIFILAFSALLFFLILFFMILFVVRYRESRNPVPSDPKKGTIRLEILWISASTLLVLAMFAYGLTGFDFLRKAPPDSMVVKVYSRQWSWLFEYQNGKKSPDLVVPVDRNVKLDLYSSDVIHGFYVPAFRLQQDALPGLKTFVWFKATTEGSFDILCSQYCGLSHSIMLAKLYTVPEDQFAKWIEGEEITLPEQRVAIQQTPGERLLFERGCLTCHSITGTEMTGPTFKGLMGAQRRVITRGVSRTITVDEKYIHDSIVYPSMDITDGFKDIMPSGRDILSDREIGEIIELLKELQ